MGPEACRVRYPPAPRCVQTNIYHISILSSLLIRGTLAPPSLSLAYRPRILHNAQDGYITYVLRAGSLTPGRGHYLPTGPGSHRPLQNTTLGMAGLLLWSREEQGYREKRGFSTAEVAPVKAAGFGPRWCNPGSWIAYSGDDKTTNIRVMNRIDSSPSGIKHADDPFVNTSMTVSIKYQSNIEQVSYGSFHATSF
jgi:hypothetical protein